MGYMHSEATTNQSTDAAADIAAIQRQKNEIATKVGELALKYLNHFDKHSKLENNNSIPQITWDDLQVGRMLGQGGFSDVHQVKIIRQIRPESEKKSYDVDDSDHSNSSQSSLSTIDSSSQAEALSTTESRTYAVKHLKKSFTNNIQKAKEFKSGAVDLALEGQLLSKLNHENIIKVHATSGCVSTSYIGNTNSRYNGYFLVLDELVYSVQDCIQQWQIDDMKARARTFRPSFVKGRAQLMTGGTGPTSEHRRLLLGRLQDVLLPVANAMQYLHDNNIIFRDLKPSNIGFDASGNIKLFDFGLAREIINPDRRMTGCCGSLRYMAPEVARREHYGLKADVHSFGILLWEMCTLTKPFDGMNRGEFFEFVALGNMRPNLDSTCGSSQIQSLIKKSWDEEPDVRPTFKEIVVGLKREVAKIPDLERTISKSRLYQSDDTKPKAKVSKATAA